VGTGGSVEGGGDSGRATPRTLRPTEADIDLAITQQRRLGDTALRRAEAGEDACGACRHFLDPDSTVSYCWHPDHRTLVDAAWRCAAFAPDTDR
jgi:hypothetical protein